ncbi:MAG: AEC family transporter [Acidobacteria bacterium]|nr:AEC family transporter [Acidobacteriota bacterium]MBV9483945.1 AEC family transporter [Acidobacteriota bacterium]
MIQIIGLLLPIFAIIALGRAAVRFALIDPAGVRGLNDFTYWLALPALLFDSIAMGETLHLLGIASIYLAGCLLVYGLALLLARVLLHMRLSPAAAFALSATYGNAIYFGTPIVSAVFGIPGLMLILPIIALHSGVLLPLASALIEYGSQSGSGAVLRKTLRSLLRNPIIMAIAGGFLWHIGGMPVPAPAHALLGLLGKAAPSLALFCVGTSLPTVTSGSAKEAALAAAFKLIVLPAVIGAASLSVGMSGLPVKVALITAAMPTGANAFMVARRAPAFADTSAFAVVITLIAALPVLSGLLFELERITVASW